MVGPVDPTQAIEVTIRLRSRAAPGALEADVNALGAVPPAQRSYLTPEEFTARYGADPADVAKVTAFAHDAHLTVVQSDLGQRVVVLSGTAGEVSAAFRVELVQYNSPRGAYRGRVGPVQVPADLAPAIEGIFGLDNRPQARPHIMLSRQGAAAEGSVATALSASGRSFLPPQIGEYYNFPAQLNGAGQCIGILEFGGGYRESDLQTYFRNLNLPAPRVTARSIDGVRNDPGKDPDVDGEVMLDIEVAASLAPGAEIVVYFAPFTEKGWVDALTTVVHDNQRPSVLSISWGFTEGQDIWTSQAIQAVNQAFQAAALMGITVCCASGDDGSEDQLPDGRAHVDFPASSPYVLACGGTSLRLVGDQIAGETVWNSGSREAGGGATGGGISEMNALPSWQQGIVPPSVNPDHHVGRGVPDVAGDADGRSGYTILVDGHTLGGVGGTSAVAPLWAGLIARVNQQLGKPVGFINPLLYGGIGNQGVFHDITTGNNDPTGKIGGYAARAGWDPCTGWGSPDGTRLVQALTGTSVSAPTGVVTATAPEAAAAPRRGGCSLVLTAALVAAVILVAAIAYMQFFGL
jgi:kumamolisin